MKVTGTPASRLDPVIGLDMTSKVVRSYDSGLQNQYGAYYHLSIEEANELIELLAKAVAEAQK